MRARPVTRRQRGAAIITAMLTVLLATTIVAGLVWRAHVTVRSVENRGALTQTHWIERAVIDWARVVLRVDLLTSQSDNLGEVWAQPIPDTVLDETVTAGAAIGDPNRPASLNGQVYDAQGRFNLNNLLDDPQDLAFNAFQKLLELAGEPSSLAVALRNRIQISYPKLVNGQRVAATALPLLKLTDLRFVSGFSGDVIAALEPYVIFLPVTQNLQSTSGTANAAQNGTSNGSQSGQGGATVSYGFTMTPVNVNTADPLVLAAVIPSLDIDAARRFTSQPRLYRDLTTAGQALGGKVQMPAGLLSVSSSYFLVRGVVRYDRVEDQTDTLLYRQSTRVDIVWQQGS